MFLHAASDTRRARTINIYHVLPVLGMYYLPASAEKLPMQVDEKKLARNHIDSHGASNSYVMHINNMLEKEKLSRFFCRLKHNQELSDWETEIFRDQIYRVE